MHVVNLDTDGKITQIRQSWDQGAMLKQLEIIGKTGRNWPIRDSRSQVNMILNCLKATGKTTPVPDPNEAVIRSRGASKNAMRDPHASLSLFAPREQQLEDASESIVTPYAGTRPRQRSFTEIMGNQPDADEAASPSSGRERGSVAPKIGAGKNFAPSRLFETDENAALEPDSPDTVVSPSKHRLPHPKKYHHFDFADGSDPRDAAAAEAAAAKHRSRPSKHDTTWSFDDFTTPSKAQPSRGLRSQQVRHWGDAEAEAKEPAAAAAQKPRRDAETHFDFVDDGLPSGEARPNARPRGATHNDNLHLYENNLYNEDGSAPTPGPSKPLGNITNLSDRRKDFDSHWDMTDESPANKPGQSQHSSKISDDRKKAVNMMNANWSLYDKSPAAAAPAPLKENKSGNEHGIRIAGDGMGGKAGTNRDWLYGGDEDEATPQKPASSRPLAPAAEKDFWDF